jgi:hypothetical protein
MQQISTSATGIKQTSAPHVLPLLLLLACSLVTLCTAGLTGYIPMEISELANLEHFYASFNSLSTPPGSTQPLAGRFCMKDQTKLYSLILRANNFTGTVNMSHCTGLGLLDVQVGALGML